MYCRKTPVFVEGRDYAGEDKTMEKQKTKRLRMSPLSSLDNQEDDLKKKIPVTQREAQ